MPKFDQYLKFLVEQRGSDLHCSVGRKPMMRVDGDMKNINRAPLTEPELWEMMTEIAVKRNLDEFRACNDSDFAYAIEGLGRFRVNYFRDRYGPGCVFRLIPEQILTAAQLGLPPIIQRMCLAPRGLILVTGPTGSGKSTTLATMLDTINATRSDHIITIEDPIEFVHRPQKCKILQREVGVHTKSFRAALRSALRMDPDIVLVGEMRDLETISLALETAETGHLVFGTLHTTTASSTVDRIIDQFPSDQQQQIRVMLSETLRGVIAHTLLKRKGVKGRVAAMEILIVDSGVSNMIREGKTYQIPGAMETGGQKGMEPLNRALFKLVKSNQVEVMDAYMAAIEKLGFKQMLLDAGYKLDLGPIS